MLLHDRHDSTMRTRSSSRAAAVAHLLGATRVAVLFGLGLACCRPQAQHRVAQADQPLPPIVVSGSRGERAAEDVPASISVITADEIEQRRIEDIHDLVRDEPAVSVRRQPARFSAAGSGIGRDGNAGFNIRGIDGNRVLIQIDGIRVPSGFSFGPTNAGRGDYLDVASIARVEILRGPASALYGSDGLAGAVSFYTREPGELLRKWKRDSYVSLALGYDEDDHGKSAAITGAARLGEIHEALVIASTRRAGALENFGTIEGTGSARTAPNPEHGQADGLFVKWVTRLAEHNRVTGTFEALDRGIDTEVLTGIGPLPSPSTAQVVGLTANDDVKRTRGSLSQTLSALRLGFADRVQWSLYGQDASTRQFTSEQRSTGVVRLRDQLYEERVIGVSAQADKTSDAGALTQRLIYGIDLSQTHVVGTTDGTVPPMGESFPIKRFPDTDYKLYGAFVQDEIGLAADTLLVIPALRYDRYTLKPEASPQFPTTPAASDGSALSPKLGLVWKFAPGWSAYANLARGFRAPTPDQVNNGFTNQVQNYRSIANPDLKPETNRSLELGLRKSDSAFGFEAAAFAGRYKDFISQVLISGDFTAANPAVFQFVNLGKVELEGVEAKGAWQLPAGFALRAGYARVRGRQIDASGNKSALNSVDPAKLIAGVSWRDGAGRLGVNLDVVHRAAKKAADVAATLMPPPAPPITLFLAPSSTVVDLTGSWKLTPHWSVSLALRNLGDKKYWQWSDVSTSAQSTVLDAYTQPGRSASIGLKAEF